MTRKLSLVFVLLHLLFHAPVLLAVERILDFHSDIKVLESGEMRVTEWITVVAEGNRIKRGIYRDFPTRYKDKYGNNYRVEFRLESVKRDDIDEPYRIEGRNNGVRIYIGNKNKILPRGKYTYSITYHTSRQLGFFEKHDELYWNVTGNDWAFTIEQASATVMLPAAVPMSQVHAEAYTGAFGSKAQNYTVSIGDNVYFETTQILLRGHGLTIVATWPKGFVHEPTTEEKLDYFFNDNRHLLAALAGIAVLLLYYLYVWHLVGKDPESGVIIPQYEPPSGYSPASMRFVEKMGYDKTCFASAILNLAVKGYLTINEDNSGNYNLEKTSGSKKPLAPGEASILKHLFSTRNSIKLTQSNHRKLSKAIDAHRTLLKANYEKIYFVTNRLFFLVGIAITVGVIIFSFLAGASTINPAALFLVVWLTGWTFGVFTLLKSAFILWKQITESILYIVPAIGVSLFALPFVGAELFATYELIELGGAGIAVVIFSATLINWIFYELLKAPTRAGRELLDKVEGFKNYIELAEKHDLDYRYPKGRCPELFELYLPYALALGIEQQWGEQFADVLAAANTEGRTYSPGWYHGHDHITNLGDFSSSFTSSFNQAISSSSTAPGSSSGSGGGGSSGGGGGGGGGGGW